ncbi:MAG: ABC transporter permease [Leifsonia sp.]
MTTLDTRATNTSLLRQFLVHARCEAKTFWTTPGAYVYIVAMPLVAYAIVGFANRDTAGMTVPFGSFHLEARERYYAAMMVFATFAAAFTSTAIGMGSRRLDGRFRRLRTTAANPVPVMGALLATWFVITVITDALITVMAIVFFGVRLNPDQAIRVIMCTLFASACYMALGFAVSLFFRSPESAAPLANLVFFPLVFLSGVFYDVQFGDPWGTVLDLLPLRPLLTLLAGAFGSPTQPLSLESIFVLLGWLMISVVLIVWRFRWSSESEPRHSRIFARPASRTPRRS